MATDQEKKRPWGTIALVALILLVGAVGVPSGSLAHQLGYGLGVLVVAGLVYSTSNDVSW